MSSVVSSAISSTAASAAAPSNSACAQTSFTEFPTKDAACAVGGTSGVPDNYEDILKGCCKSAPVETWGSDCALWCLAADQSIADLQKCWQDGGVKAGSIQCNQPNNATATGEVSGTSSSGNGAKETGSQTSGGASSSTSSPGAAPVVVPQHMSKAGLGMLAMVLGSAVFGALL
ncbi:hypothetical protein PMIN06_004739 [Paraphaeosphaeria minitans]|uniref:Uncharacterized protein n=1 Tax=Paraphaeosphaeria minitans TaxID=565426 RepID=A0A9P6GSP5_9PLEO|nr:hypothetical protein PMIN01_00388 [Paraphaeosphaeria minitans]